MEEKWANKEKETDARIQLQEVVANIDLLNDIKDRGLVVDEELDRLKEIEKDCGDVVDLCVASSWAVSDLDLPQMSEDSTAERGEPSRAGVEASLS